MHNNIKDLAKAKHLSLWMYSLSLTQTHTLSGDGWPLMCSSHFLSKWVCLQLHWHEANLYFWSWGNKKRDREFDVTLNIKVTLNVTWFGSLQCVSLLSVLLSWAVHLSVCLCLARLFQIVPDKSSRQRQRQRGAVFINCPCSSNLCGE